MKKQIAATWGLTVTLSTLLFLGPGSLAFGQGQAIIEGILIGKGGRPSLAVTDFRGAGRSQDFVATFNSTLYSDLQGSGLFTMVAKSMVPLTQPQRPSDFRPVSGSGLALEDWAHPPASATYLAFGYAADQGGVFVLYGFLYDVTQKAVEGAQVLAKTYTESMSDSGARTAAHKFAADIIEKFGGGSLAGSKIYFVSDRTGNKEIWMMDYTGEGARQLTHSRSINIMPGVAPDGSLVAYTTFRFGQPRIEIVDTATLRIRQFFNPEASVNSTPSFTPDGKTMYFASSLGNKPQQIYRSTVNGGALTQVSHSAFIETEPKVNPKNPRQIAFVSGRSGGQQVYLMNSDGLDVSRLTNGQGEASNPSWHPDGHHILFSWTQGYAKGDWNVFIMDVATRQFVQLTHSEGRNENPVWAPDGRHVVFMSTRGGKHQIYTMLADGTDVKRLTTQGQNYQPVWGR